MTLNMLFFTITIKKKTMTLEECLYAERAKQLREEYIVRTLQNRRYY